ANVRDWLCTYGIGQFGLPITRVMYLHGKSETMYELLIWRSPSLVLYFTRKVSFASVRSVTLLALSISLPPATGAAQPCRRGRPWASLILSVTSGGPSRISISGRPIMIERQFTTQST